MQDKESKWSLWVKEAQGGNKISYKNLLSELSVEIEMILNKRIFNSSDREDILQEILFGIHKALPSFQSEKRFKPWFHSIVNYKIIDYIRTYQKTNNQEILPEEILDSKSERDNNEEAKDELILKMNEAIELLPNKQKLVFKLMKLEGKSLLDVQKITGMSISAIKVTSHRAMKNIKKEIQL